MEIWNLFGPIFLEKKRVKRESCRPRQSQRGILLKFLDKSLERIYATRRCHFLALFQPTMFFFSRGDFCSRSKVANRHYPPRFSKQGPYKVHVSIFSSPRGGSFARESQQRRSKKSPNSSLAMNKKKETNN